MAITRTTVTIAYTDGRQFTYPITPKLQMEFERVYHVGLARMNDGDEGATNTFRLAWLVQKAHLSDYAGALPGSVEEWVEGVDAIDVGQEKIAPFVAGASANGSHPSALLQESAPASS